MRIMLKTLGKSAVSLAVLMFVGAAFADGLRGAATVSAARGGKYAPTDETKARGANNVQRWPTMPVLPLGALGNKLPSNGNEINTITEVQTTPEAVNPTPNPTPTPTPGPNPDSGNNSDSGNGGQQNQGNNSCDLSYTVDACMSDIAACVSSGALPNGINSMFDAEVRDSIFNGMNLCMPQVDYCIANVHLPKNDNSGCVNMYQSALDVWADFNARRVQPAYYSFVLSRTGLTPIQAENTCLLLDRNTYGASFNAVGSTNNTTSEYANGISAYNQKPKKALTKDNPQGDKVNTTGTYDANRGYYARWDAQTAQCLVRVAAYNRDTLITNDVFGIGNKEPAQVWRATGDTFTCNKDLFGFSLMNDTKKAAIVAVPVGTAVGAGIGALAGKKASEFNCADEKQRRDLTHALRDSKNVSNLRKYLIDHGLSDVSEGLDDGKLASTGAIIDKDTCDQLRRLYEIGGDGKEALENCEETARIHGVKLDNNAQCYLAGLCGTYIEITSTETQKKKHTITSEGCPSDGTFCTTTTNKKTCSEQVEIPIDSKLIMREEIYEDLHKRCSFKELNQAIKSDDSVYCEAADHECVTKSQFELQINEINAAFSGLDDIFAGTKGNKGKAAAIGAASGAAAGGTATLITALVEKNRINCRVGDDLDRVEFNKSYTIDRLRDFYVKWALQVPTTISVTSASVVTNCSNWNAICETFTNVDECANAKVAYMPDGVYSPRQIDNACDMNGIKCQIRADKARQFGIVASDDTTLCPITTESQGSKTTKK